ncbi:hypothetical protein NE237_011734 [Protea cynaroides]|uniref:Uncharacterized protein n=1 Tax=Protea cynaroides TaxID=273540 RepID=A0A9Q0GVH1_9MAGN|nr:hypothetical protein NE237_011734 [Protea cynaroides]
MSSDVEDGITIRLRRDNPTSTGGYTSLSHHASTKPNPNLLSFCLQTLVMAFVTSLFFIFLGIAAIVLLHICLAGGDGSTLQRPRRRSLSDFADENAQFGLGFSSYRRTIT